MKIISFDLDGTLSDSKFDKILWDLEIPKAYAEENNISLKIAQEKIRQEYDSLWGAASGNWRDVTFWLRHFELQITWVELLKKLKKNIRTFDDVVPALENLSKQFKLIIISNADRNFLKAKIQITGLEKYFEKTYSASSDFDSKDKTPEVYLKILEDLRITPEDMIHIGDDAVADVKTPQSVGVRAFLLNRDVQQKNAFRDLRAFAGEMLNTNPDDNQ